MRKLSFDNPRKWLGLGPAIRAWGGPRIPGRYRVVSFISGSVTKHTLSRRDAIRTYQHRAGRFAR